MNKCTVLGKKETCTQMALTQADSDRYEYVKHQVPWECGGDRDHYVLQGASSLTFMKRTPMTKYL